MEEYEKYVTTVDNVMKTVKTYGVAIIPSVLNSIECSNILDGMWNFLEHISSKWIVPINRYDSSSWYQIYNDLLPLHSMLF